MSSSTCASKPAEKSTSSGLNSSSAGSHTSLTARRSSLPPEPAASGTLYMFGAGSAQRRMQRVRVHRRVRVEVDRAAARGGLADRLHIFTRMHALELLVGRERRFMALEVRREAGGDQLVFDGGEPLGPFRMMR